MCLNSHKNWTISRRDSYAPKKRRRIYGPFSLLLRAFKPKESDPWKCAHCFRIKIWFRRQSRWMGTRWWLPVKCLRTMIEQSVDRHGLFKREPSEKLREISCCTGEFGSVSGWNISKVSSKVGTTTIQQSVDKLSCSLDVNRDSIVFLLNWFLDMPWDSAQRSVGTSSHRLGVYISTSKHRKVLNVR